MRSIWITRGLIILAAASILLVAVAGFYRHWYGGTSGEIALGAIWAVTLIAVGAALRHTVALIVPAVVLVGVQVLGRYWLAHPGTFNGPPAEPGVVTMTSIFLTALTAFFIIGGWCTARMVLPAPYRRRRLGRLALYTVFMGGILGLQIANDGGGPMLPLFLLAPGIAGFALGRLDAVPVLSLAAWIIAFVSVAGGALLFPSPNAGETPLSFFLESPFWILLPTLLSGCIGVGLRAMKDAMLADSTPVAPHA